MSGITCDGKGEVAMAEGGVASQVRGVRRVIGRIRARAWARLATRSARLRRVVREEQGQGTTEYAILVGVLVVIAIVAIIAFRGKLQELWDAISNSINGL